MKKLLLSALALSLFIAPAMADTNQFNNWQKNKQYNNGGEYHPPKNYHKKKKRYYYNNNNNNYNDEGAAIVGGFIGGLIGGMLVDPGPPPAYVPPAYQVPNGGREVCTTIWTMEPDGFGGWQRAPHTACYWE